MGHKKLMGPLLIVVSLTSLYCYFRYHYFQAISIYLLPLYTINKIVAVTSFFSLGMALWYGRKREEKELAHLYGEFSLLLVVIHLIFSGLMMSVKESGRITLAEFMLPMPATLSLLVGVLAFIGFIWIGQRGLHFNREKIYQVALLTFILSWFHIVILGNSTWGLIDSWPLMMPPLTLITSVCGVYFIIKAVQGK